ncbi:MAG: adhesin, partial [Thermoanaerobaculia bacterium]
MLAALAGLLALGCAPAGRSTGAGAGAAGDGRLGVMVTVPPQAYLVERIGGERVAVEVLMPPGSTEETFA